MNSIWWYVARASGIVAWFLAAGAVVWGLLLSTKVLRRWIRANWLLDLHRFLGGLTVAFVGVHLIGLWLDPFVSFALTQFVVPFASDWNPIAVAWGVVALYLLVAIEVSSLLRRHLPRSWWRGVHMSSYLLFVVATVHLLTAGTDRHSPLLLGAVVATTIVVAALTLVRALGTGRPAPTSAGTIRETQPIG